MSSSPINVVMPQMGESITEATITAWRKKVGDDVKEGEPLLDISTAKVEVEIPAPGTGTILEILHPEGATVPIDTLIARLGARGAVVAAAPAPAKVAVVAAPKGVSEEALNNAPSANSALVEETNGSHAGRLPSSIPDTEAERQELIRRRSTPVVRNMAAKMNIDLLKVPGTGIHGRVTKQDLESYIARPQAPACPAQPVAAAPSRPAVSAPPIQPGSSQPYEELPVSIMRRTIADHLSRSMQIIPHAYTVHEVDMTKLDKLREKHKNAFERQHGAKLTPLVFLTKAVADTLLEHPLFNASYQNDKILRYKTINMGVAVAVNEGLVVPVLKHVETLSLVGIAQGINDLAQRARQNKLKPTDMEGGTFTLTSPGQLGSVMGLPIINYPQAAILHMGGIRKMPVVVTDGDGNDVIAIRQRVVLTLGIDHRLIDGWASSQFLVSLRDRLQRAEFGL